MSLFANVFGSMSPRGSRRITGAEARRMVGEQGALLVDVRTPAEVRGGTAPGAINIPLQELSRRVGELPMDRPVVVYCHSGGRSASAAAMLGQKGYTVFDAGGLSDVMR